MKQVRKDFNMANSFEIHASYEVQLLKTIIFYLIFFILFKCKFYLGKLIYLIDGCLFDII